MMIIMMSTIGASKRWPKIGRYRVFEHETGFCFIWQDVFLGLFVEICKEEQGLTASFHLSLVSSAEFDRGVLFRSFFTSRMAMILKDDLEPPPRPRLTDFEYPD